MAGFLVVAIVAAAVSSGRVRQVLVGFGAVALGDAVGDRRRRPRRGDVLVASAELSKVDTTVVRCQEVQEALVVLRGYTEQLDEGAIVPASC